MCQAHPAHKRSQCCTTECTANVSKQSSDTNSPDMAPVSTVIGLCLLICGVLLPSAHAGKVLVVPVDGSHWINIKVLMVELIQRGHELTVIRPSNSIYIEESSEHFYVENIPMPGDSSLSKAEFEEYSINYIFQIIARKRTSSFSIAWDFIKNHQIMAQMISIQMTALFEDKDMMERLRNADFDMVLADPFNAGGVMLAHYLKLPLVFFGRWMPTDDIHFALAPSPLSYVPVLHSRVTDRMLFPERVKNVLLYSLYFVVNHFIVYPAYDQIAKHYLNTNIGVFEMYKRADIYLMKVDFVFEFPRPMMPNAVYIGGFQCRPPKNLPQEIQEFMDASEEGVVVFTLGALVKTLPPIIAREIAAGLAQLSERVIWRYTGEKMDTLGNNTMTVSWLPQNDLLSHPNTKAFIAHGGENGVYEAIYHGVPIVGVPIFGDQYENILRLKTKGASVLLENLGDLKAEDIFRAVRLVIDNPSYGNAMRELSRLHRDTPIPPLKAAVFWTEFVMRHGGAGHLRAAGTELPWYQYYLIDVIASLTFVLIICIIFVNRFFRVIVKRCFQKKQKKNKIN
ncbi:UDP-glucuronosyltransferase 2C1-like [Bombina bombina]|uniref:UDP-glucuronosyltransferase 2C1-like n=1 Tax=Bombina bombina TaxID=8345 RepID=UPI00235AF000|nr:UDP-glucuronosyltransferase 2C1-like [Bombina bombina]